MLITEHTPLSSCLPLWEIAFHFRDLVCSELRLLPPTQRLEFRGDYVFVIDNKPSFIVMVEEKGAWSVSLSTQNGFNFVVEEGCSIPVTVRSLEDCIAYFARSTITTDSVTLQKLLRGRLKAKIAFLTSKVTVSGDLAAFMKMVSLLKKKGVQPLVDQSSGHELS